ncbi:MAG: NusA-like transcription termination signal-binding factor [Nanoarchaeota archaeon]|nr:NusA-like transcription termination signal-binding factor [Nanoarchaeota archaeon]
MSKILFDVTILGQIQLFEKVTHARVKDCIASDVLLFIIETGDMGKAVGKKGIVLKKVEGLLKKPIKLVEFNSDVCTFVQQYLKPLRVTDISFSESVVTIKGLDGVSKGNIIGRERKNLKFLLDLLQRYFTVERVDVV